MFGPAATSFQPALLDPFPGSLGKALMAALLTLHDAPSLGWLHDRTAVVGEGLFYCGAENPLFSLLEHRHISVTRVTLGESYICNDFWIPLSGSAERSARKGDSFICLKKTNLHLFFSHASKKKGTPPRPSTTRRC